MIKKTTTFLLNMLMISAIAGENQPSLLNPFQIHIDPMQRLLLVNFENDPDSIYIGLEPQVFDDPVNGRGHLVIGWRTDGRVDVYHQPGLSLNPSKYDIAGKGLAYMTEREMDGCFYQVDEKGARAFYRFEDLSGREIVLHLEERNRSERKPFGLLAPMGQAAEYPSAMPLVLLHDFYFVRRENTLLEVTISGRKHTPDELPVKMDGQKMYFARYSPTPLIATLNPAGQGQLVPLQIESNSKIVSEGDQVLEREWKNERPFIRSITRENDVFPVQLRFKNPFPCPSAMADNSREKGRFELLFHPTVGKITGKYLVEKSKGQVNITLHPAGGWKPRPDRFSLRLMYTMAKVFRKWPTTYVWHAELIQGENDTWIMNSKWTRTNRR